MEMYKCETCGIEYPKTHPALKYCYEHGSTTKMWQRRYPDLTKHYRRKTHLRERFNITVEDYDRMLAEQEFKCAACGKTPEENGQRLAIDYDHNCCPKKSTSCGKCIRGLLCSTCNLIAGYMDKYRSTLDKVLAYIRQHE